MFFLVTSLFSRLLDKFNITSTTSFSFYLRFHWAKASSIWSPTKSRASSSQSSASTFTRVLCVGKCWAQIWTSWPFKPFSSSVSISSWSTIFTAVSKGSFRRKLNFSEKENNFQKQFAFWWVTKSFQN